jgi:hypothetical protein
MTRRILSPTTYGSVLGCVLFVSALGTAQTRTPKRPPSRPPTGSGSSVQSGAALGPAHAKLATMIGSYDTVTKFRMQPSSDSAESSGTAKISGGLDGRFLIEENSGTMFGEPTTGLRLVGYNIGTKQYEAVWTYTGSTGILMFTGKSPDSGKTINWTGSFDDENGEKQALTAVTRIIDGDHFVVELHAASAEGPVLETTYSRKANMPKKP